MLPFKEIFTGTNGRLSSKRIIGTICIGYSILLASSSIFFSGTGDIPMNVLETCKEFLLIGGGMVTAGTFEKKQI
jgi:hypothetical protein